jgi:hypothetical protein
MSLKNGETIKPDNENNNIDNNKHKKSRYMPTTFLIIIVLMLVFIFISLIGQWTGAETTVPVKLKDGTYEEKIMKVVGLGITDVFVAI